MCGIVGALSPHPEENTLRQMLALLRHRGPDQAGIYLDDAAAMGSTRLSILDVQGGQQPIGNEDRSLWIVFNGEIFNYRELRAELLKRGHRFETQTDTEVVLHLYEEFGADCLTLLNGQFALAIWDTRRQRLFLGRDRFGIAPLFYTIADGALLFASEIKALLGDSRVQAEIDPAALDQIFTYWSALSARTAFKGIHDLPPGHWLTAQDGEITVRSYWRMQFDDAEPRILSDTLDEFRALLLDATRIRLNADVPVGAYLSGGLDSSTIAALINCCNDSPLATFSISFGDAAYDESRYQRQMAAALGGEHHTVHVTEAQIGEAFREVVWHAETPLLRTAPAPMYLLSRLVHDSGFKVVLTGEGADEFLAGYELFKEAQVRRFWARQPDSTLRPALLRRVYPNAEGAVYLSAFFGQGLGDVDAYDYSHRPRWNTTSRAKRFFSPELRHALADCTPELPYMPPEFARWDSLQRAQYLEASIFLPQYLLSSQGDRMAMAHSVEGRYPFLDHRLVEFFNRLPSSLKLNGLTEKYLLKKLAKQEGWLPDEITRRRKQPYRAPVQPALLGSKSPQYVHELLSCQSIRGTGLFDMAAVFGLLRKVERGLPLSEGDEMALAGIVSTQLLHHQFVAHFTPPPPMSGEMRIVNAQGVAVTA